MSDFTKMPTVLGYFFFKLLQNAETWRGHQPPGGHISPLGQSRVGAIIVSRPEIVIFFCCDLCETGISSPLLYLALFFEELTLKQQAEEQGGKIEDREGTFSRPSRLSE